jgi:hypothetical protein
MSKANLATNSFVMDPRSAVAPGYSVNGDIPVAGVDPWKRETFHEIAELALLPRNWDGQGSHAPRMNVKDAAIELIRTIPSGVVSVAPRVVPVSGGGFHFEWSSANRELEVSVEQDGRIETLRVENGMPLEDERQLDLRALFVWLTAG